MLANHGELVPCAPNRHKSANLFRKLAKSDSNFADYFDGADWAEFACMLRKPGKSTRLGQTRRQLYDRWSTAHLPEA